MTDPQLYVTLAASGLMGLGMVVSAGLAGWRSWLSHARSRAALTAYVGMDIPRRSQRRMSSQLPFALSRCSTPSAAMARP